jgi:pyruvate dehydrogenase E2 component (dihydrolipoamide acetyltransferase)
VPDLGEFADVEVIEVLVAEGTEVEVDQGLVTLETDKATMEVPAPRAGRVLSLLIHVGDRVSSGDPVLTLSPSAEATVESARPVAAKRIPLAAAEPLPKIDELGTKTCPGTGRRACQGQRQRA